MSEVTALTTLRLRTVRPVDAAGIAAIDASHGGVAKLTWWKEVIARHTRRSSAASASGRVGLVVVDPDAGGEIAGYLLGQVRAFEFGSEPCGWVFSVGVHQSRLRQGIAALLFQEARVRFGRLGVRLVRTMVKRDDVSVLSFFRSQGFSAGPYVEMEMRIPEQAP